MRPAYVSWLNHLESERRRLQRDAHKSEYHKIMAAGLDDPDPLWMATPAIPELHATGMLDMCLLMNFQRNRRPEYEKDHDGWFPCPAADLLAVYGPKLASLDRQSRMLNRLEKLGYVKRRVQGKPPTRWLWIDFEKFFIGVDKRHQELHEEFDEHGQRRKPNKEQR